MRAEMPIWLLIAIPILGVSLLYFIKNWWAERRFYSSKKWDYLIDNPDGLKFYNGEVATEDALMSNESRVKYGYPFFMFVIGFIFIGFVYCVYKIQNCEAENLKQCGITIRNGEVSIGN
jgi:hypothetical protein